MKNRYIISNTKFEHTPPKEVTEDQVLDLCIQFHGGGGMTETGVADAMAAKASLDNEGTLGLPKSNFLLTKETVSE